MDAQNGNPLGDLPPPNPDTGIGDLPPPNPDTGIAAMSTDGQLDRLDAMELSNPVKLAVQDSSLTAGKYPQLHEAVYLHPDENSFPLSVSGLGHPNFHKYCWAAQSNFTNDVTEPAHTPTPLPHFEASEQDIKALFDAAAKVGPVEMNSQRLAEAICRHRNVDVKTLFYGPWVTFDSSNPYKFDSKAHKQSVKAAKDTIDTHMSRYGYAGVDFGAKEKWSALKSHYSEKGNKKNRSTTDYPRAAQMSDNCMRNYESKQPNSGFRVCKRCLNKVESIPNDRKEVLGNLQWLEQLKNHWNMVHVYTYRVDSPETETNSSGRIVRARAKVLLTEVYAHNLECHVPLSQRRLFYNASGHDILRMPIIPDVITEHGLQPILNAFDTDLNPMNDYDAPGFPMNHGFEDYADTDRMYYYLPCMKRGHNEFFQPLPQGAPQAEIDDQNDKMMLHRGAIQDMLRLLLLQLGNHFNVEDEIMQASPHTWLGDIKLESECRQEFPHLQLVCPKLIYSGVYQHSSLGKQPEGLCHKVMNKEVHPDDPRFVQIGRRFMRPATLEFALTRASQMMYIERPGLMDMRVESEIVNVVSGSMPRGYYNINPSGNDSSYFAPFIRCHLISGKLMYDESGQLIDSWNDIIHDVVDSDDTVCYRHKSHLKLLSPEGVSYRLDDDFAKTMECLSAYSPHWARKASTYAGYLAGFCYAAQCADSPNEDDTNEDEGALMEDGDGGEEPEDPVARQSSDGQDATAAAALEGGGTSVEVAGQSVDAIGADDLENALGSARSSDEEQDVDELEHQMEEIDQQLEQIGESTGERSTGERSSKRIRKERASLDLQEKLPA